MLETRRLSAAAAVALLALPMTAIRPASAQEQRPTFLQLARQGQAVAEKLCQSCHVIDAKSDAVVPAGVPTMRGIANSAGQTSQRLRSIMLNPHPPMPDVRLSYPEVDQLLAYFESLRDKPGLPPLFPRQGDKPVYPDPS